jgi:Holliday junction resolvase RusA-like endonuclease
VIIEGDPPAWNHSYKIGWIRGHPTIVKERSVEVWQDAVAWKVRNARPSGWQPERRVRITVDWRTTRARDCDAGLKALLDAIAVGLGCNDRIFLATIRSNEVDKENPRTIIEIENEA